jgi:hypothetical protein
MSNEQKTTDWLVAVLADARRQVDAMPAGRRDAYAALLAPPPPDPCRSTRRCDEAQTCAGGCIYAE